MVERKAANWLVPSFSVAATALALILFATGYRPSWIFVDWNGTYALPFTVTKKMEIASRWYPLKRSSISLICSSDGLRLMTKAQLPAPADARANMNARPRPYAYPLNAQVTFDWVRFKDGVQIHSFKTKASIVDFGEVDTIVTAPLSRRNAEIMVNWFERGAPQNVSIGFSDSGVNNLEARVEASDVLGFVEHCGAAPKSDSAP
jgi:hypothetical protein